MSATLLSAVLAAALFATSVRAETHTIRFDNQCGYGTPQLIQGGNVLSTGEDYVSDGVFSSGIAYLQTGDCLFNGENCMILEMTLTNPTGAGGTGSSSDISLISPHGYNVQGSFSYFGGCDNTGANCASADCADAFFQSDQTEVQVACQSDNVNLLIAFCADATTLDASSLSGGGSPSSAAASSSYSPAPSSSSVVETTPASSSDVVITTNVNFAASSAVPTSYPPVSSSVVSANTTASASSSTSSSSVKCPGRNAKRSLRLKRSAAPEPEPELKMRMPYDSHRRHHARHASSGSFH